MTSTKHESLGFENWSRGDDVTSLGIRSRGDVVTSHDPKKRVLDGGRSWMTWQSLAIGSLGWLADDVGESQATCGQTDRLDWACEYRVVLVSTGLGLVSAD